MQVDLLRSVVFGYGCAAPMRRFDLEIETSETPDDLRRDFLSSWTAELAACGYSLTSQSDVGVTYAKKYRRWYIILLAVLLFPIGLLFLLARDEAAITATVEPDDDTGGAVLLIRGLAPRYLVKAFEKLAEQREHSYTAA